MRRTTLGSVVHFKCFDGMVFSGDFNSTTCLENGTWSNPLPNCLGINFHFICSITTIILQTSCDLPNPQGDPIKYLYKKQKCAELQNIPICRYINNTTLLIDNCVVININIINITILSAMCCS